MASDDDDQGAWPDPFACGFGGVEIVDGAAGGVVAVHGVPGRPERRFVGPEIDLPVAHRVERPGLREGLSRGVLQKYSI